MNLFAANHVKLLNSCYPPNSTLLAAGPDYSPNSHELSRLTYYASNHPSKLAKIGSELEKRLRLECRKAKDGNARSRASLLISLAILRSLATECRRDIVLLSPYLVSSVDFSLSSLPSDLDLVARAASVFTAWTTYTNGSLTNADHDMTNRYLSILRRFSALSASKLPDQETQNRTRLIGLAALSAAINSEVLYHDAAQFGAQVSTILQPSIQIIFETSMTMLNNQSLAVKGSPASPYLTEFRTRPAVERRAASIHIHVDGDKGPSLEDVSEASLRALFALLSHSNGEQLRYVMQSLFTSVDQLNGWDHIEHCCWMAKKVAEWAQYQYRYVVPTWLVDHLLQYQDVEKINSLHHAVMSMIQAVFSSPTPLINLSSSDIMSTLLTVLLRRTSINPDDGALAPLVGCISSLGCHVYYSDQIPDLTAELIGRLVLIEVQGILIPGKTSRKECRSSAIHSIFKGLLGLLKAANNGEPASIMDEPTKSRVFDLSSPEKPEEERPARRTKVTADIWQDTLSLLCDPEPSVRRECADALVYYITKEMPKYGENRDFQLIKHPRRSTDLRHSSTIVSHLANPGSKFLNAVHGYLYVLAISPSLSHIASADSLDVEPSTHTRGRPSIDARPNTPKLRKQAMISHLIELAPSSLSSQTGALEEDYANILKILNTIQLSVPVRGLFTGIPMLLALDRAVDFQTTEPAILQRIVAVKSILAHVFLTIGQVWNVTQLTEFAEQAIRNLSTFPSSTGAKPEESGINVDDALLIIASSRSLQDAISSDQEHVLKRFKTSWTPELALKDFESSAYDLSVRGDGVSPLLKISPALMHIENISLHSLARSTRGLGVTDLRDALEGRASLSNPALARPPSISTLDHTSFLASDPNAHPALRLTKTRSRTKKRSNANGSANEVRDVLTRLGIGKQNGSLLKNTFQKGGQ
ncbi:hypothetical protein BJ165DRAFT_1422569 [Panaeolus papilionaceus]|nr:hypothetical protein BJ165DRAFT_1422569 [Panaeolus papilionaceus]